MLIFFIKHILDNFSVVNVTNSNISVRTVRENHSPLPSAKSVLGFDQNPESRFKNFFVFQKLNSQFFTSSFNFAAMAPT